MARAEHPPVLQVQDLHFAHAGEAPIFTGWSFDLSPGVSLLEGDMGGGKTTLLRLLAGEWQGRGELRLRGLRQSDDPAAWRREVCWFDPRDPAWDPLTPPALMDTLRQRHPGLDADAWQRHAQAFGLQPHLGKAMFMLSTGLRRKAALAVALSAGCALTLLDEPAGGLDAPSLRQLEKALNALARDRGRALLMVSSLPLAVQPPAKALRLPHKTG